MGTLVKNVVINWSKSYETISFLVIKLNSYDDTFDDGDNDDSDEID